MKKVAKTVVFCLMMLTTPWIYSFSPPSNTEIFADEGGLWVKAWVDQYPEILWLADSEVRKTEEGRATLGGSYSEALFGQKYIEFDRTLMTLRCLKLILNGSDRAYEIFTAKQARADKLSRESFHSLHLEGYRVLTSFWEGLTASEMMQAMETALVLGDLGKSDKARAFFKAYGIGEPDHDDFHGEVMQLLKDHPHLCPSFANLPAAAKTLLVKVSNLAHYGHITHLEGGPAMFKKLKESAIPCTDALALNFDLFVHLCDVAGALGHVDCESSLAYTELTHRALESTNEAVRVLTDPNKTEWDAFYTYLGIRAAWLGLNVDQGSDRILTRIGTMLRLFTPEEGLILKEAMGQFDEALSHRIIKQFDVQPNLSPIRTPTYVPATLVNLASNQQLGQTQKERLLRAVKLGLPFVTRVLERYHLLLADGEIDPTIPLNFNRAAGVAKSNPEGLNENFNIDRDGNVIPCRP